jgi:tripeptide aminopeptidase
LVHEAFLWSGDNIAAVTETPEPDLRAAADLVMAMMAIAGPSGREGEIVRFVRQRLRRAGIPAGAIRQDAAHRRSKRSGDAGNLIVKLPGTYRAPRRLLMAHVDTVPICEGCQPVRRGQFVRSADAATGLGADNRSGAAAILVAALALARGRLPHPPLTFLWTIQEEWGLVGSRHVRLADLGRPRMAFNFDSGQVDRVIVAATGAVRIQIDIEGIASHAGVHPEDGVSAITVASLAISRLHRDGLIGRIEKGRRRGTGNVGRLSGGEASNVVAPHVQLSAEVRSHDKRFRQTLVGRFRDAFERAAREVRNASGRRGRVRFRAKPSYESFRLGSREPAVIAAREAVASVIGRKPLLASVDGGLDANNLTARGLPTVTLGAGQHGAHTVDEYLDLAEFEHGCRVALRLATGTETQPAPGSA